MEIYFQSVTLKRFRSFLEESTLHFDSAGHGLYFLKGKNETQSALGSNGAGKSSVIDAFMWCLYGKTIQGLKNPDVIPWTGKGTTEVTVDLKDHKVVRTIGPNLISIDGKEAGQEYVDKLISIPYKIIPYTIVLGQRQPLFFDLTASEKLKLFSECLELDRWDDRSEHAKNIVSQLDVEISKKENEINLLDIQIVQTQNDIQVWKEKSEEWEQARQNALAHQDKDKSSIEAMIVSYQSQIDIQDLALDRAETELRGSNIEKLRNQYRTVKLDKESLSLSIKNTSQLLAKSEADLDNLNESLCPTCGQLIHKEELKKMSSDIKKKIKAYKDQLAASKKLEEQKKSILDDLSNSIEKEGEALVEFKNSANDARDQLLRLNKHLAEFKAQLKSLNQRIEDYEKQDNPFNEEVRNFKKKLVDLNRQLEQDNKKLTEKKEYLERARPWIKWFKDIKLYLVEEILQELEITTNSLIEEFGLVGWSVHYDVERETKSGTIARGLNVEVLSPSNKQTVKWEVWSGGEAQRLRLIGALALRSVLLNHIGISTNLLILDEPTESLSQEGVRDLVNLLASWAKETKSCVWMIDHHVIPSEKFVSEYTVVKNGDTSSIQAY